MTFLTYLDKRKTARSAEANMMRTRPEELHLLLLNLTHLKNRTLQVRIMAAP